MTADKFELETLSWPIAQDDEAGGVFHLTRGLLKAQIKALFLQVFQFFPKLIRGLVMQFLGVHAPIPFNITGRPPKRVALLLVEFMVKLVAPPCKPLGNTFLESTSGRRENSQ